MRIERLLLEHPADDGWSTFAFHPGMSIIGGVGPAERDALVSELIGSLTGTSNGVHTEFRTDKGKRFAVVRSSKVPHMVIDSGKQIEVTDHFTNEQGDINVFDGLDMSKDHTHLVLTDAELVHRGADDRDIDNLARLDQTLLWEIAEEIDATAARIDASSMMLTQITEKNSTTDFAVGEAAFDALEAISFSNENGGQRDPIFWVLGALVFGAVGVGTYVTSPSMITMITAAVAVAIALGMLAHGAWPIIAADRAGKGSPDGDSLFSMQLDRVNTMLAGNDSRKIYREATAAHEQATEAWISFTGGVDLTWTKVNRSHIENAAEMFRMGGFDPLAASPQFGALVCRLGRPESIRGESMPMIMSEPFASMTSDEKRAALHLLALSAGDGQRILLSADPEVAQWASEAAESGEYHLDIVAPSAA